MFFFSPFLSYFLLLKSHYHRPILWLLLWVFHYILGAKLVGINCGWKMWEDWIQPSLTLHGICHVTQQRLYIVYFIYSSIGHNNWIAYICIHSSINLQVVGKIFTQSLAHSFTVIWTSYEVCLWIHQVQRFGLCPCYLSLLFSSTIPKIRWSLFSEPDYWKHILMLKYFELKIFINTEHMYKLQSIVKSLTYLILSTSLW